jgi:type IV secretion system protein VirB1
VIPADCDAALNYELMRRIVHVESSGNQFAIGVVGATLVRQPVALDEAVATAEALRAQGRNFSIGIAQVNKVHFDRLGWSVNLTRGFDKCANVAAGAAIFNDCLARAKASGYPAEGAPYTATHAALSCYYAGSFTAGARLGYVSMVLGAQASAPERVTARRPAPMMLSQNEE